MLKDELLKFLHEIVKVNQQLVDTGNYKNLISLCELDIRIIKMISEAEQITIKDIYTSINSPKTTVISAVDRLAKKGYVSKKADETDRRKQCIYLTPAGEKANEEHENYENHILNFVMNQWNENDQNELSALLKRRQNGGECK